MNKQEDVVFNAKYILLDVPTGLMSGADSINEVAEMLVINNIKEVDVLVPSELVEMRISKDWDDKYVHISNGAGNIGASICLLANNISV